MITLFPTWALPAKIRSAVEDAVAITQAPCALAVGSALAAASLAVQAKFDVRRFGDLVSPCSLYFITFAESGERKTTIDRSFFSAFGQFEESMARADQSKEPTSPTDKEEVNSSNSRIRVLYTDVTPQGFVHGLWRNSPSAGLIEDEAGRIFTGRLVDDLGLLNKLWDGRNISVDRRAFSIQLRSPRATINWLVQPDIFRQFMDRKGDKARGIGFLARCLVCFPVSTQGTRLLRSPTQPSEHISEFRQRILNLLHDQIGLLTPGTRKENKRIELTFSTQAQAELESVFNRIETAILPGGFFCENRDYASKIAENIARLAGVFHAFEGNEGTAISLETLQSATTIVLWYAEEFVRLFAPPQPLSDLGRDAGKLEKWLIDLVRNKGMPSFLDKNFLLQYGPNSLRQRDRLTWVLDHLQGANRLMTQTYTDPRGKNRKTIVILNDAFFGNIARGQRPYGLFPPIG